MHNPQLAGEYAYQPYRPDTLKSITSNLKTAAEETEMLKHTYGAVNIILADTPYTLMPKEYYDEQYERELYRYNIGSSASTDTIMRNVVGDEQTVVLFAIEKQLHKYITTQYPKARVHAAVAPLIHFGMERSYAVGKKYSLLHMGRHSIDFICCENASPIFVNTFQYRDPADALFYLLNCWTTLGLSQTDDTLHIAGQSRHSKTLVRDLKKFIRNIHIIRPAEEFHSSELARIGEMPFDLQALISCE